MGRQMSDRWHGEGVIRGRYYLRFIDPTNSTALVDPQKEK